MQKPDPDLKSAAVGDSLNPMSLDTDGNEVAEEELRPVSIEVNNVSKTFKIGSEPGQTLKERVITFHKNEIKEFWALNDVSFKVRRGETVGILGRNGSGKSTLLKIVAGTVRPTSGDTRIRGRLAALLELGAGFHPDLTGRENVYLNGSILGLKQGEVDEIFEDVLAFSELESFIDLQVKYYSSGMRARLGFAVATHLEPDILLVDEVLSVGDEAFQRKCMDRVHRFRSLDKTMLFVSHSPERVRELCDRAVVLHHGRELHFGDVAEAIEIYRKVINSPKQGSKPKKAAKAEKQSKKVTLLDGGVIGLGPKKVTSARRPVSLLVRYELHEDIDFRIRVTLKGEDGTVLMNRATNMIFDKPLSGKKGLGKINLQLDYVPVCSGCYHIAVTTESPNGKKVYDHRPRYDHFNLVSFSPILGLVNIDLSCSTASETLSLDLVETSAETTRPQPAAPQGAD